MDKGKPHILIVIGGPTGSGKTRAGIALAQHYQSEVISADSRQVFREMRIGTGVPEPDELAVVPHHMIQCRSVASDYSVGSYVREVLPLLDQLFTRCNPLFLVGGSGLYIRGVCEGLDEFPDIPPQLRDAVRKAYEQQGLEYLQREVARLDPGYYEIVDRQNPVRLMRALEVCRAAGKPYSSFRSRSPAERNFRPIYLRMALERDDLYHRIEKRIDGMLAAGLEAEARSLYPMRHLTALQTVGYQEFFGYFSGQYDREEAVRLFRRNSRRYAKRQETWFRKNDRYRPFAPDDLEGMITYINKQIP